MPVSEELRNEVMRQTQGAMALFVAHVGVANRLFEAMAEEGSVAAGPLASRAAVDEGYVVRWLDAAYAFGYVDATQQAGEADGAPSEFTLTEKGRAFLVETPGSLMPFAVMATLSGHMMERAAGLMPSGERPGEVVLGECSSIVPLFGPMLEGAFGGFFKTHILPGVPAFERADRDGGLVVDLGCGNGWYLRALARAYPRVRGVGLDLFPDNITGAKAFAERDGVSDRLDFHQGDLHDFAVDAPATLITMSRALHHVWSEREDVFRILRRHLEPGGQAVIWEPAWPDNREELRAPAMRGLAAQNLAEHVQGNHLLRPAEIVAQFERVGMAAEVYLFAQGKEAVVVGTR